MNQRQIIEDLGAQLLGLQLAHAEIKQQRVLLVETLEKAQHRLNALRGYVPPSMHAPYLLDLNEIDAALARVTP